MEKAFAKAVHKYIFSSLDVSSDEANDVDKLTQSVWDEAMRVAFWDDENFPRVSPRQLMRVYGSPEELKRDAKLYRNFAGSQDTDQPLTRMYQTSIVEYKSFRKKEFTLKHDNFKRLYDLMCRTISFGVLNKYVWEKTAFGFQEEPLTKMMLAAFLKSREKRLENSCEFVPLHDPHFNKLSESLRSLYVKNVQLASAIFRSTQIKNYRDALVFLKKHMPQWSNEDNELLEKELRRSYNGVSRDHLKEKLLRVEAILVTANEMMCFEPSFYQPGAKRNTLRLFQDGEITFLMETEVDQILKAEPIQSDKNKIFTVDFRDVVGKLSKDIEVICVPIIRTDHRAQPIRDHKWNLCKLASDCFTEAVYDALIAFELYGRIGEDDLDEVNKGFERLGEYFNLDEERVYFMSMEECNKIPSAKELFSFALDRPVRHVRDVGPDGFTVQDFIDELNLLNLNLSFQQEYLEGVYNHVLGEKSASTLRTCDMMKAVSHCMFLQLITRFPKFGTFLDNQNAGHRLLKYYSGTARPQQFRDSKLNDIRLCEVSLHATGEKEPLIVCPDKTVLKYRFKSSSHETLESQSDIARFLREKEKEDKNKRLGASNLKMGVASSVTSQNLDKVFLRYVGTSALNPDKNRLVFVEDALEEIQFLLAKRNDCSYNSQFKAYVARWKSDESFGDVTTWSIDQLTAVLEEFDIDKSLITLVPDVCYSKTVIEDLPFRKDHGYLLFTTPTLKSVLSTSEAIYIMFMQLTAPCTHPTLREKILEAMKSIEMSPRSLHANRVIDRIIDDLQLDTSFIEHKTYMNQSPTIMESDLTLLMSFNEFFSNSNTLQLKYKCTEGISKKRLKEEGLPVWKARLLIIMDMCDQFFGDEHPELKAHVKNAIYWRTPIRKWESEKDFLERILNWTNEDFCREAECECSMEPDEPSSKKIAESSALLRQVVEFSETCKSVRRHVKQIDVPVESRTVKVQRQEQYDSTEMVKKLLDECGFDRVTVKTENSTERGRFGEVKTTYTYSRTPGSELQSGMLRKLVKTRLPPSSTTKIRSMTFSRNSGAPTSSSISPLDQATEDRPSISNTEDVKRAPTIETNPEPPALSPPRSTTPPPKKNQKQLLAELLKEQDCQEETGPSTSQGQGKPSTGQVSFANIKYESKKYKSKQHQIEQKKAEKPIFYKRPPVTDQSPQSNNCENEKCKRTKLLCEKRNAQLMNLKKQVAELEKDIRKNNRQQNAEAAAKKEEPKIESSEKQLEEPDREKIPKAENGQLAKDLEDLEKKHVNQLKESGEREKKLKEENAKLISYAKTLREQHEKEKKEILRDNEEKMKVMAQELNAARQSVKSMEERLSAAISQHENEKKAIMRDNEQKAAAETAQNDFKTVHAQLYSAQRENVELHEQLDDALLQLRMSPSTRLVYLKLRETEQTIRWQDPMKEIRKKTEKIMRDSEKENERDVAKNELEKFAKYEEELASRIQMLIENPESADVVPMGEFPKVSNELMRAYTRLLKEDVKRLRNGDSS